MNPNQVKRREYLGLAGIGIGVLSALVGVVSLLFLMPLGLSLIAFGAATFTGGVMVLTKIPDLVGPTDETW